MSGLQWKKFKHCVQKCDIVILQETWLSDADIPCLATIDTRFYIVKISHLRVGMRTYQTSSKWWTLYFMGKIYS